VKRHFAYLNGIKVTAKLPFIVFRVTDSYVLSEHRTVELARERLAKLYADFAVSGIKPPTDTHVYRWTSYHCWEPVA
jgi:hypothetical protein